MKYLFTSVLGKMCKYDHWEDLRMWASREDDTVTGTLITQGGFSK